MAIGLRISHGLGSLTPVIWPFSLTTLIFGSCLSCALIEVFKLGSYCSFVKKNWNGKLKCICHNDKFISGNIMWKFLTFEFFPIRLWVENNKVHIHVRAFRIRLLFENNKVHVYTATFKLLSYCYCFSKSLTQNIWNLEYFWLLIHQIAKRAWFLIFHKHTRSWLVLFESSQWLCPLEFHTRMINGWNEN